ncbi:histidine--tRNA ligase [Nocardia sp. NPDC050697]|uniref:histidine--tRNA ligase n=1 Tax=Nocardia sp. NPDC050697 TaxID=3155158 RepID=UPI0033EFE1FF
MTAPTSISGFPEYTPEEQLAFNRLLDIIRQGYERFGFSAIETPAVERQEVLLAKAGSENEKQIYSLARLAANEEEDDSTGLALHFDLTVPLARYVATRQDQLTFPFRRYQIQKVWRGERPQSGRFREFYQCDIDIIGNEQLSLFADAEIPSVIYHVFSAMDIGRFKIRVSNRKVLQGFLEVLGVGSEEQSRAALQIVDSLEKIGVNRVMTELGADTDLDAAGIRRLIEFVTYDGDTDALLAYLDSVQSTQDSDGTGTAGLKLKEGVEELKTVVVSVRALGVPDDFFAVDLRIARGLDYYTGTVYETVLVDHPSLGSICSGGRYDNLASHFTNKQLPGVGISIGLTRLFSRLVQAGIVATSRSTPSQVMVAAMNETRMADYFGIANELRTAGINTEVYIDNKRLGGQLKYASRKGFDIAVIAGDDELAKGTLTVKDLQSGSQREIARADLLTTVQSILSTE